MDPSADARPSDNVGWLVDETPPFLESAAKLLAVLALKERTGYKMLQDNRQRTYGPPPGWDGPPPPHGCELYVGNIPRDMYEDELVPQFERAGQIYEFRLMLESSGKNRGYGFVKFSSRDEAYRAIQQLNHSEVRPGRFIIVCPSFNNCRLFIKPIPRHVTKDHILEEMKTVTYGVEGVIVPQSCSREGIRNWGFAFIKYESHKAAALARRRLITVQPWGHHMFVDWAELETDLYREDIRHVKVLHVCNLQPQTSKETLHQEFSSFSPGCVEHVKKCNSYAFICYHRHSDAMMAFKLMNGAQIDGAVVEIVLCKNESAARRRFIGQGNLGGGGGEELGFSKGFTSLLAGQGNPLYSASGATLTGSYKNVEQF